MLSWRVAIVNLVFDDMMLELTIWIYTLSLGAYMIWQRSGTPKPWWLRGLAPISIWAFAPALLLPLTALVIPSWLYHLGALALFALYSVQFVLPLMVLPRRRPASASQTLKVMTVNLYKRNRCYREIVDTIAHESPDIVALQEVRDTHARVLARRLGQLYPYRALTPGLDFQGMGLLSRFPILSLTTERTAPQASPIQVASLDIAGAQTWLLNTHPRVPLAHKTYIAGLPWLRGLDMRPREEDVACLTRIIDGLQGDVILAGDLNTTDQCLEYRQLAMRLRDTFRKAGRGAGFSFPVNGIILGLRLPLPILRIDHIFVRGDWRAQRAYLGKMPGSDHRYVVAELARSSPCK
jgi:endonuclease/exonuclease/phosphatase (EEP) superfamily protein YafD